MKKLGVILGVLLMITSVITAAVVIVPDEYSSLSAAYSAASDGDVILVKESGSPYTISSTITITGGKDITIRGESITGVVLNGPADGSMFFVQGNTSTPTSRVSLILRNLTIQNCSVTGNGGAVRFDNSQYTKLGSSMDSVRFINCSATGKGGAIYGYKYLPNLSYCYFENCNAGAEGGALFVDHQGNTNLMTIENSTFFNCSATSGSAIYNNLVSVKTMELTNCTFGGNSSSSGAGALSINSVATGFIKIYNCTFNRNNDEAIKIHTELNTPRIYIYNTAFTSNSIDIGATSGVLVLADFQKNLVSSIKNIYNSSFYTNNFFGAYPSNIYSSALSDNGGVVPTYAITTYGGAVIIDRGISSFSPSTDQTGASRGTYPDIGALEYDNSKVNRWIGSMVPSWSMGSNWTLGVAPNESGVKTDYVIIDGITSSLGVPNKASGKVYATNFVLRSDGAINLNGGGTIDVDNLFILSAQDGAGAVKSGQLFMGVSGSVTSVGDYHVEQYLKTGQWNFLSSIDSDIKSEELIPGKTIDTDYYLYEYSEPNRANNGSASTNNEWVPVSSGVTLGVSKGYIVWVESPSRVLYDTYSPNGTTNFTLSYTDSEMNIIHKGWNLTGNPYSAPLDWDKFTNSGNIDKAVYYYNNQYQTYFTLLPDVTEQNIVPPMQAFFVKSNINAGTLSYTKDMQTVNLSATFKSAKLEAPKEVVKLSVIQDDTLFFDKTYIAHSSGASRAFEGASDAYKLWTFNPDVPQLYSVYNSQSYSVNSFDFETSDAYAVTLGCKNLVVDSTYKFVFELTKDELGLEYALQDNILGETSKLSNNDTIEFKATNVGSTSRFKLLVSKVATSNEFITSELSSFKIFLNNKILNVWIEDEMIGSEFLVYDVHGKLLHKNTLVRSRSEIDMTLHNNRIVFVVINGNGEQISKRMIIR